MLAKRMSPPVPHVPDHTWRIGPDNGARDRVDTIYHSDSLYSAVTGAMAALGLLEEWLEATARNPAGAAVRFSSCFPFQGDTALIVPPRSVWPAPASTKVRWKGARFVPIEVVESLIAGRAIQEDGWAIDTVSQCLLPSSHQPASGPFRIAVRSSAAVDRAGNGVAPHSTACLEFTPGSGLWMAAAFRDDAAREEWTAPLTGALRLLADSGFGGERSRGWGRSEMPEIAAGDLSTLLLNAPAETGIESAWWMLSLYHPAASEEVDWTRGNYEVTMRSGRVESDAGWGQPKRETRMVAEGSVLIAASEPQGSAPDVAPENFAHPVYRAGFALALPIPWRAS
jgi:CRISPR type III-A-associated RAMP protein Csm4